jgi:hypothetical protein
LKEKITSDKILKALAQRHIDDFFMTEVKNGPTQYGSHFRMDAVAIKKSWANPCISCYEVKVDRQDFLRDEKWPVYMGYCNRFSFACPEELIQKEELPPEVGLYWYTGKDRPFKILRHPMYRTLEIPADFFMYIIMCKIQSDRYPFFQTKEEYFQEWLENKRCSLDLGTKFSYKISEKIIKAERQEKDAEKIKEDASEAIELQKKAQNLLRKHGIDWSRWDKETWVDGLQKYLESGTKGNSYQLRQAINQAEGALNYLRMIEGGRG